MLFDGDADWGQARKRSKNNDGAKQAPGSKEGSEFLSQAQQEKVQSLQSGGRVVESMISKDEQYPELWDVFTAGATADYTLNNRPQFYRKKVVVLPEILLEQYSRLEIKCFIGIFAEINRAWITIDNQLFLWNYDDGSDFCVYDGLDQVIVSVGLVKPKKDVFVEDIQYLLVICTPVEILLLAVCFEGNTIYGELSLHPTQLSIPSDNVNMLSVAGTPAGRIFLAGKDGCLYELIYRSDNSWFSNKIRKLNHSQSILGAWMPGFLNLIAEDPLINLQIDTDRGILYSLSKNSSIRVLLPASSLSSTPPPPPQASQVFDLGINSDRISAVAGMADVVSTALRMCPRLKSQKGHKEMHLRSIHVISTQESSKVHLMALTSTALRLYFTTWDHAYSSSSKRPSLLEMVHVRFPPDQSRFPASLPAPPASSPTAPRSHHHWSSPPRSSLTKKHYSIDASFYAAGVCLLADASSSSSDLLLTLAPDTHQTLARQTPGTTGSGFFETASLTGIEGKVWAMAEVPDHVRALDQTQLPMDSLMRNELAVQHLLPPRVFLCLTNAGVHVLVKIRPVDQLLSLLLESGGMQTEDLSSFFDTYGMGQACAMCLILACSDPRSLERFVPTTRGDHPNHSEGLMSPAVSPDANLVDWATQAFFKFGGRPRYDPTGQAGAGEATKKKRSHLMGEAVMRRPEVKFSPAYTGLGLFLARLLRPVWDQRVKHTANMTARQLARLEEGLAGLKKFLKRNPQFAPIPSHLRGKTSTTPDTDSFMTDRTDAHMRDVYAAQEAATGISLDHEAAPLQQRLQSLYRRRYDDEAREIERSSLANLHILLTRSMEVLGFLSILSDHRYTHVVSQLPKRLGDRLGKIKFRQLVTTTEGFDLVRALVDALVGFYTDTDSSSVDAISEMLGRRCPSIFGNADRIRFKAEEQLIKANRARSEQERQELLNHSLQLFLDIPAHVYRDLGAICSEYQFLNFFRGPVRLCLAVAAAIDPAETALQWYRAGMNPDDETGSELYAARQESYRWIIAVFDELFANLNPEFISKTPTQIQERPELDPTGPDLQRHRLETFESALSSKDPLFHLRLYSWFMANGLESELLTAAIRFDSPYLEEYLKDTSLELLSKFYVLRKKYGPAALCLSRLAEQRGIGGEAGLQVSLNTRVNEFLARAIMCAKSAPGQGELLHELEEKMEVGQIQLEIQTQLKRKPVGRDIGEREEQLRAEAWRLLDFELLNISDLYNKFAKKFGLWECCLAILHCSGHHDPTLVKGFWEKILLEELYIVETNNYAIETLRSRLVSIGRRFHPSELVLPLGWLINCLEVKSLEYHRWDYGWVVQVMREIGVGFPALFEIYNHLFDSKDSNWQTNQTSLLHLLHVMYLLVIGWADFRYSKRATPHEIQQFKSAHVEDAVEKYIMSLGGMTGTDASKSRDAFKNLLLRLKHIRKSTPLI